MPSESRERNDDSLSPGMRRAIEGQFDRVTNQSGLFAAGLLRYLRWAILIFVLLFGIAFVVDYVKLRMNPSAIGSVTIQRYYVVGLKNGKTEMSMGQPETEMCVNSVFPHLGYYPCWYLRRHNMKQIDV